MLQVQGKLSIACYLTAVDKCYTRLCQKVDRLQSHSHAKPSTAAFSLADIDYCVMHVSFIPSKTVSLCPTCRMCSQRCLWPCKQHLGKLLRGVACMTSDLQYHLFEARELVEHRQ